MRQEQELRTRGGLFTLGAVMVLSMLGVEDASAKCAPNNPDCSCIRRAPTQPVTHPRDEARLQGAPQILDLEDVASEGPSGELKLMQDERTLRQLSQHSKQCLSEEVMMSVVDYSIYMSFMPIDLSNALLHNNEVHQGLQARIEELHTTGLTCRLEEAALEPSQFDITRQLLTREGTTSTFEDLLNISALSRRARTLRGARQAR